MNNFITTQVPERASMNQVVMKKSELLEKLLENKAKHDAVLEAAIHGYWAMAKAKIEDREKNFYEKLAEYKEEAERQFSKVKVKIEKQETLPSSLTIAAIHVDTSLGLVYPEDHTKDYDRAIAMMKSTVYDEVILSVDEFDAYVMNEWSWKNNFVSNALFYASNAGLDMSAAISGCAVPFYTGVAQDSYAKARHEAVTALSNKSFKL